MADSGWWLIIAFVTLVNPATVVTGIMTGLVVRRWWQAGIGMVTAPAAYWIYGTAFSENDHFAALIPLLPCLALAGFIWTCAVFAVKKAAAA
ncbi:MAG: hypothetical protein BVN32_10315 [Proteobacteria bacterium ST_bin14]|nr:MAG: hypothetical protein BVN32_10315 [Proteobacteria bacterium ST_bin14]